MYADVDTMEASCSFQEFVLENSLIFKTGQVSHEFTKPEIVFQKKDVVLVDVRPPLFPFPIRSSVRLDWLVHLATWDMIIMRHNFNNP